VLPDHHLDPAVKNKSMHFIRGEECEDKSSILIKKNVNCYALSICIVAIFKYENTNYLQKDRHETDKNMKIKPYK
jgi:hypothetical protein